MKTLNDRQIPFFHIHDCHRQIEQSSPEKEMEEAVLPDNLKRQLPRSKIAPARCVNSLAEPGPFRWVGLGPGAQDEVSAGATLQWDVLAQKHEYKL